MILTLFIVFIILLVFFLLVVGLHTTKLVMFVNGWFISERMNNEKKRENEENEINC